MFIQSFSCTIFFIQFQKYDVLATLAQRKMSNFSFNFSSAECLYLAYLLDQLFFHLRISGTNVSICCPWRDQSTMIIDQLSVRSVNLY